MMVSEYVALAELGAFDDERVELSRGRVVRMAPQGEEHAWVVQSMNNLLVDVAAAQVEVFRTPVNGAWTERFTLTARDTIRPLAFPDVEFPLAPILLAMTH